MRLRFAAVPALIALVLAPEMPAAEAIGVGDRVRLLRSGSSHALEGVVVAAGQDRLEIVTAPASDRVEVPWLEVRSLEVARQRSGSRRGAAMGALLGLGLGLLASNPPSSGSQFDVQHEALVGGAVVGGAIGAGVGHFLRHDVWVKVATPKAGVGSAASRGIGVSVSVAF